MEQSYAATIPGDEPGRTTRLPRRPGAIVRAAGRQPPRRLLDVTAVGRDGADRAALEHYVRTAFNRSHDADVSTFMPTLLAFRDGAGTLRGVLGLRSAADQPLYLENYLDRPVEQAIVAAGYHPVERDEVVEVGNLAAGSCLAAVRMVSQMPVQLMNRGYCWIVFTATSTVHEILLGLGAPLVELGRADPSRVARQADRWGRYYDNDPRVYAGYLPDSRAIPGFVASSA
jgi:hypothetical protein